MKRALSIARAVFVSLEMLLLVVLGAALMFVPKILAMVGQLPQDKDVLTYVVLGPPALVAAAARYCWKLLYPKDNNTDLVQWPLYGELLSRAFIAVAWAVLGLAAVLVAVFARNALPPHTVGFLLLAGWGVGAVAVGSQFLAALVIRSIVEGAR